MQLLWTILVTFFAGMGAGLGTGFAGMSAAAVISPMLITFLHMDPYMAVGIALSSDVLASAVSAYTYHKNKNLDVRNGLIMMGSVLTFGKLCGKLAAIGDTGRLFGLYDIFARDQIYRASGHDDKRSDGERICRKTGGTVRYLWRGYWIYLWLRRCRRRYDDAFNLDKCSWV